MESMDRSGEVGTFKSHGTAWCTLEIVSRWNDKKCGV